MALYEIKARYDKTFLGLSWYTPDLTQYEIEQIVLDIVHQNGLTIVSYEEPEKGRLIIKAEGTK